MDTSRVETFPTYQRVWLRVEFPSPIALDSGGRYDVTMILQDLDCERRLSRSVRMNAFLRGEDSTAFYDFPDTTWLPFGAQQLDEVYSRGACGLLGRRL